jgi:broad specificity phosphatase PhoE
MTLPEQSDRAVAQTREFLVRLTSPYVEGGIKGIRREVRDEASRLLRHYPYVKTDEKRCVGDMSGATDIVTRLRNWREVHLARLMEETADEMSVLQSDNNRRADLEAGLREGVEQLQAEVRRLEAVIAALADQDATLAVQGGNVIVTMDATLTDEEREAVSWCVEMAMNSATDCVAEIATLRGLLERL